ncbi:NACHT domain-containing protein [Streptomyces sp. NPDC003691]
MTDAGPGPGPGPGREALVVQVRGEGLGTGVRISPHLVLTSARIVGQRTAAGVTGPRGNAGPDLPVLWSDSALDAAVLLAGDGRLGFQPRFGALAPGPPVTGRITGCHTMPTRDRDRDRLDIRSYTGTLRSVADPGTLLFDFETRPPLEPLRLGALGGLLGAPVFAGGTLVGLVQWLANHEGRIRAHCLPLRRLAEHPGLRALAPWLDPSRNLIVPRESADDRYEREYAEALADTYRRTRVLGIDGLPAVPSQWDLDTAYLDLEGVVEDPSAGPSVRFLVESLLTDRPRILLRGEPGSGKTTLLTRLAVRTATGASPYGTGPLVPFLLPLRALRAPGADFPGPGDPLPLPPEFPRPPEGWALRVLSEGRALLLADGVDELPEADREAARRWLTGLLGHFPGNRCVTTVRPHAVATGWLAAEGFAEVRLLPMGTFDLEMFVSAWHRATEADTGHDGDGLPLEQRLLRWLGRDRSLRDFARTPLLCTLVCALHTQYDGRLPHGPWTLYREALELLLGERDARRAVGRSGEPEGIRMSAGECFQVLQRIAAWQVRSGWSEISRARAIAQIDRLLSRMPELNARGTAEQVLRHLLHRSGVLVEAADGSLRFVHRPLQEFLAAKALVEEDAVDELIAHAPDEEWSGVVLLAGGHCGPQALARLIRGLLLIGSAVPDEDERTRLYVLAGRCAENARLAPEVRGALDKAVRTLLPPRDHGTAESLAALGSDVLRLLPPADLIPPEARKPTTHLIRLVTGPGP